jgi:hypothetical protein
VKVREEGVRGNVPCGEHHVVGVAEDLAVLEEDLAWDGLIGG